MTKIQIKSIHLVISPGRDKITLTLKLENEPVFVIWTKSKQGKDYIKRNFPTLKKYKITDMTNSVNKWL